jgi:hypothetical protein
MEYMIETFHVFKHAIMITGFVFMMMLLVEYINVQTKGAWQKKLVGNPWKTYLFAGILGALPGCLGAFTAVTLFSHRFISFGAIVTTMIATSGDEAFVMFAMIPEQAFLITGIILVVGILAGWLTDKFYDASALLEKLAETGMPLHEKKCESFQKGNFFDFIKRPSLHRIALGVVILFMIIGVVTGVLLEKAELWKRITLIGAFLLSLFIVLNIPHHFLKEHIWNHIVKVHIPRIFLWTFGTLLMIHLFMEFIDLQNWIASNLFIVLLIAVLIGIIPESGPHLIFVTMFVEGAIPLSILLASSIVQDGHGMLPLFAESKRGFFAVKKINVLAGLMVGIAGLLMGF